jgi:hypothetical protein
MGPIRSIRAALERRAYDRANREFEAYQSMPAGAGWSVNVSCALLRRIAYHEQRLCALINGG